MACVGTTYNQFHHSFALFSQLLEKIGKLLENKLSEKFGPVNDQLDTFPAPCYAFRVVTEHEDG